MSLASVIETTRIDHGDGCKCTQCSYLKVVVIDPDTCEPVGVGGGNGEPTDLTEVIACLEDIKTLLAEISAKLC